MRGCDDKRRPTNRRALRWASGAVIAGIVAGCAPPQTSVRDQAATEIGAALDPRPVVPPADGFGRAESGLVVLREPTEPTSVLFSLFTALETKLSAALWQSFTPDAVAIHPILGHRQPAAAFYNARLNALNYGAEPELLRGAHVRAFARDNAVALWGRTIGETPPSEDALRPGDWVLQVTFAEDDPGRASLFGPELIVVLRPYPGGEMRIARIVEEFVLPSSPVPVTTGTRPLRPPLRPIY